MPKADRRANRLPRHPRKQVVTVNDILARDDVNGILSDLNKDKQHITDLIVLYKDDKGVLFQQITPDTAESTAIWMLEAMKFDLLNEGD